MIQYGLKFKHGWLARDAVKRHDIYDGTVEPLKNPDLWQDKERAEELARQYGCQVVQFRIFRIMDEELFL